MPVPHPVRRRTLLAQAATLSFSAAPLVGAATAVPRPARAGSRPPAFTEWVGRVARVQSPIGSARLLLAADGTGLIDVRFLFACRSVPVLGWRMSPDALSLDYRRRAALDPRREVHGHVRIEPESGLLRWTEAEDERIAEFRGFEPHGADGRC